MIRNSSPAVPKILRENPFNALKTPPRVGTIAALWNALPL
jgi:hypothetical protein